MPVGYLCLVLHAHLPFVRHPEYDDFMEEDWLYEGITETYLPLLEMFDNLERDGVNWQLTMSVSPTLAAMLDDPLLQSRYVRHIDNLIALAEKELQRTRDDKPFHDLALMYHHRFHRCKELFENKHQRNLLNGFRHFFDTGRLELMTCAATHGFLPLMTTNWNAVRAQIEIGCREFQRHFGRRPKGIWLPECGYAAGIDHCLRESGIDYFFVDTHGVLFAAPRPRYAVYAPILCPGTGVAAFARDTESSKQVWSSIEGYPGDPVYRDFYRDVGFDLDYEYVKPHLHEIGHRTHLGIKYYKITGETVHKQPYHRPTALHQAYVHASNFVFNRERQVEYLAPLMDGRPPIIVAPYDAELFGHWWFEGPEFLDGIFRKVDLHHETLGLITPPQYLEMQPLCQVAQPSYSSWGAGGYAGVWLDAVNDWIYPHLHHAAERMTVLARHFPAPSALERRALNQAARELLLAQASDWAFIMKTGTVVEYANERTITHIDNFLRLDRELMIHSVDDKWLAELEARNNLFPDVNYRLWA
jgi:1,4-alpha-glucan branching enzyme